MAPAYASLQLHRFAASLDATLISTLHIRKNQYVRRSLNFLSVQI